MPTRRPNCSSFKDMAELTLSAASLTVRALNRRDLPAYKSLRDAMLAAHP